MERKIYVTVDIDWANDLVLEWTLDLLEENGVPATIFVTHQTPLLKRLHSSGFFEVGLHPNFRPLLAEKNNPDNAENILDRVRELAPEALSVRSHALLDGSDLLDLFASRGLTHESNLLLPFAAGLTLRPFRAHNGMIRAPYGWEDDVHCLHLAAGMTTGWSAENFISRPGLKIFNFHPVHLFLNTEDLGRLAGPRKALIYDPAGRAEVADFINPDPDRGAAVFFRDLIGRARAGGFRFGLIREIRP